MARRVSATTHRWPGYTAGIARCASSTAPTRCTCAPSRAPSWEASSPRSPRRLPTMADETGELAGAWNFRDVAAATAGLRPGRLYRSSELSSLDDQGRTTLRRLGITDVADLRSTREVNRRGPGQVPDGVEVHLLPFPDLDRKSTRL